MFASYPVEAAASNWVHDAIYAAIKEICNCITMGKPIPNWPDVLPSQYRKNLTTRRTLPARLKDFEGEAKKCSNNQRALFLKILRQQNRVQDLFDNRLSVPFICKSIQPLYEKSRAVFNEGFELLTKTGVRKKHYQIVYEKVKSCPFCGMEIFDSPELPREDEDHYLARSIYPLAAANLLNLVPMGSKCNKLYKGSTDLLNSGGFRRKVINPYGKLTADISLVNSDPVGKPGMKPNWVLDLVPAIQETQTWDEVFSIRSRIEVTVLEPNYDSWLEELFDWFRLKNADETITDNALLVCLEGFVAHKIKHKETGFGFIKPKIAEMLVHHFKKNNKEVVALVRAALSKK